MDPFALMEPEETVGNLWHDYATRRDARPQFPEAAARLDQMRASVVMLLHALGVGAEVHVKPAVVAPSSHRLSWRRRLGHAQEKIALPHFDGEELALPEDIASFADPALNRAAYLWLAAQAGAMVQGGLLDRLSQGDGPAARLAVIAAALDGAGALAPGLAAAVADMDKSARGDRRNLLRPPAEAAIEAQIRALLSKSPPPVTEQPAPSDPTGGRAFDPVPHWLIPARPDRLTAAEARPAEDSPDAPAIPVTTRKTAMRQNRDEANRRDSFIMHRFEGILSWVESLNLNRMIDHSDDDEAAKAAEDQDNITLSRHDTRLASRLKLHLDLSPEDAHHEDMAEVEGRVFFYPEWDTALRDYRHDYARVLEYVPDSRDEGADFAPDPARLARVRKQFEALRPRRILHPRQIDGDELDLDAVLRSRAGFLATGQGSDRIWQSMRKSERDLAVGVLIDTSRSTESAVGDGRVIDIAKDALAALGTGIEASGDQVAIWGFSSLKRDRVFLARCKGFEDPMSEAMPRIGALCPGHYTRLGAALRHVTHHLGQHPARHRLMLVLTDGKPNDLDHYEGRYGIEDSHRAVREARAAGLTVHGVIVDEDGQSWFARIFGRGGFSLLPEAGRLTRALPDIYRSLIKED